MTSARSAPSAGAPNPNTFSAAVMAVRRPRASTCTRWSARAISPSWAERASAISAARASSKVVTVVGKGRSPQMAHIHQAGASSRSARASRMARPVNSCAWCTSWGDGPTIRSGAPGPSSAAASCAPTRASAASRSSVADIAMGGSVMTSSNRARRQASTTSARRRAWSSGRPSDSARLVMTCPASRRAISAAGAPTSSSSGWGDTCSTRTVSDPARARSGRRRPPTAGHRHPARPCAPCRLPVRWPGAAP